MAPKHRMISKTESCDHSDGDYIDHGHSSGKAKGRKRRKVNNSHAALIISNSSPHTKFSLQPLFDLVAHIETTADDDTPDTDHFEGVLEHILPELLESRERYLERSFELDQNGQRMRELTRFERHALLREIWDNIASSGTSTCTQRLVMRKLQLEIERQRLSIKSPRLSVDTPNTLESMNHLLPSQLPNRVVIDALQAIGTTPFASSLAARLVGPIGEDDAGYIARDWNAQSPWLDLMTDIREHYSLAHPDREPATACQAPIDYKSIQRRYVPQVHDLLSRTFWPGIDVSDSFQYSPEKCTVVATYKHLVIGAAFISSPQELYITYLAVRAGWEGSQIATNMLHHLLALNPKKDVILHVSVNNPAMLLYNQFGFKAEEFVVGFYEDYLDKQSRASKNAFRLRLRR